MQPMPPSHAFGAPGINPRWTRSDKSAVGTAYSASSRIWFTLAAGLVSEIYFPTIDQPQTRDLQYLVTDGATFFHDERRNTRFELEQLSEHSLGFRMTNTNDEFGYRIVKEIIADPHYPCLLMHTRLEGDESLLKRLKLYALLAPHLEGGGHGNTGFLDTIAGHDLLVAHKGGTWLALGASVPFLRRSCGFVGRSDGWTDLADNYQMDWQFDVAADGNIALMGQLDLGDSFEFTLALALGDSQHHAQTTLVQSISTPFATQCKRFVEQWQRTCGHVKPIKGACGDGGSLYRRSHSLLLAPRRQELSRRPDRLAQHSLGRLEGGRRPGRLSPGLAARHGPSAPRRCWPRATRIRRTGRSSTWPARRSRTADFTRISGSAAIPTGTACNWTKCRLPCCWPGG